MQREYKQVIFTNHAVERLQLRRISQDMVVATVRQWEKKRDEDDGDTQFIKTIQGREVHVVGHYLTDEKKWLVKSAWVRGEDDPKPLLQRLLAWLIGLLRGGSRKRTKRR